MASFVTNYAKQEFAQADLDIGADTFKVMLLRDSTGADKDLNFVQSFITAGCLECNATNYTGGWGGAGRKTITLAAAEDDTNDRANITASGSITWTALGGAANNTITGALLIKEITDDTASPVVAYFDLVDTPTNGGDFTLTWGSNLVLTLT